MTITILCASQHLGSCRTYDKAILFTRMAAVKGCAKEQNLPLNESLEVVPALKWWLLWQAVHIYIIYKASSPGYMYNAHRETLNTQLTLEAKVYSTILHIKRPWAIFLRPLH